MFGKKQIAQELEKLRDEIRKLFDELLNKEGHHHHHGHHHHPHHHRQNVRLVLTTIISKSKFIIMNPQLTVGFFSLDSLQLIDSDTGAPVQATFANQSFASDNTDVLTSEQSTTDPNSTNDTAVAGGTANVTAQADATYTDKNTGQPVTKTLSVKVPYTVIAVVAGENVALTLVQGTPQAVPPAAAPAS